MSFRERFGAVEVDRWLARSAIIAVTVRHMSTRIVFNPAVLGDKPCIKRTRISVEMILEWVASGASHDDIVKPYPELTAENVEEAIDFAGQSFSNETITTSEIPT